MTIKRFVGIEYDLLKASGFINPETGEFEKLIANDKLLYAYVRDRLKYFVNDQKGEYYDTQEAIATALSMDVKSARKSLAKFMDCGIIKAEKKKFHNYMNWRYREIEDLVLWMSTGKGCKEIIQPQRGDPATPKQKPTPKPKYVEPDFDESDLPF